MYSQHFLNLATYDNYYNGVGVIINDTVKATVFPYKCKQSHVLVFAAKYIFSKTSLVKKKENRSINVLELKFNASFQFEDNLKICGYTRFVLL